MWDSNIKKEKNSKKKKLKDRVPPVKMSRLRRVFQGGARGRKRSVGGHLRLAAKARKKKKGWRAAKNVPFRKLGGERKLNSITVLALGKNRRQAGGGGGGGCTGGGKGGRGGVGNLAAAMFGKAAKRGGDVLGDPKTQELARKRF